MNKRILQNKIDNEDIVAVQKNDGIWISTKRNGVLNHDTMIKLCKNPFGQLVSRNTLKDLTPTGKKLLLDSLVFETSYRTETSKQNYDSVCLIPQVMDVQVLILILSMGDLPVPEGRIFVNDDIELERVTASDLESSDDPLYQNLTLVVKEAPVKTEVVMVPDPMVDTELQVFVSKIRETIADRAVILESLNELSGGARRDLLGNAGRLIMDVASLSTVLPKDSKLVVKNDISCLVTSTLHILKYDVIGYCQDVLSRQLASHYLPDGVVFDKGKVEDDKTRISIIVHGTQAEIEADVRERRAMLVYTHKPYLLGNLEVLPGCNTVGFKNFRPNPVDLHVLGEPVVSIVYTDFYSIYHGKSFHYDENIIYSNLILHRQLGHNIKVSSSMSTHGLEAIAKGEVDLFYAVIDANFEFYFDMMTSTPAKPFFFSPDRCSGIISDDVPLDYMKELLNVVNNMRGYTHIIVYGFKGWESTSRRGIRVIDNGEIYYGWVISARDKFVEFRNKKEHFAMTPSLLNHYEFVLDPEWDPVWQRKATSVLALVMENMRHFDCSYARERSVDVSTSFSLACNVGMVCKTGQVLIDIPERLEQDLSLSVGYWFKDRKNALDIHCVCKEFHSFLSGPVAEFEAFFPKQWKVHYEDDYFCYVTTKKRYAGGVYTIASSGASEKQATQRVLVKLLALSGRFVGRFPIEQFSDVMPLEKTLIPMKSGPQHLTEQLWWVSTLSPKFKILGLS